jgi:hypothetical protein
MGFRNRGSGGGRPAAAAILSGLATCARCGEPIFARRSPYVRKDGTRQLSYLCKSKVRKTHACDMPALDAARIDASILEDLGDLFVDFDAWVAEQRDANRRERNMITSELAAENAVLAKLRQQHAGVRDKYLEEQTPAREDALEHVRQRIDVVHAAVKDAEQRLAASPAEPSTDALLDA